MAEVKYDAFISYRHCDLDAYVAKEIHSMIEHYHIPSKFQKATGIKKFNRVFRDREELPTTSDLTDSIKKALALSENLIVICSPRTPESLWVRQEVQIFLETHSKDHVFAVLVEGEPEESFIEEICIEKISTIDASGNEQIITREVEPLAADVRCKGNAFDKRQIKKNLKVEILRILASMLQCSFDDLKQRHREYVLRRAMLISSFVLVILFAFFSIWLYQYMIIKNNKALQNLQYAQQQALLSIDMTNEGNVEGALKNLVALDEMNVKQPITPWQTYALNKALHSYQHGSTIHPIKKLMFKELVKNEGIYHTNGYIFACQSTLGNVFIYDLLTQNILWEIQPESFSQWNVAEIKAYDFVGDDGVFFLSENCLIYANWKNKEIIDVVDQCNFYHRKYSFYIEDDICMIYDKSSNIYVYKFTTDQVTLLETYALDEFVDDQYVYGSSGTSEKNLMCLLNNKNQILVSSSYDPFNVDQPSAGLMLIDRKTKDCTVLYNEPIVMMKKISEHQIAAISVPYVGDNSLSDMPDRKYKLICYDTDLASVVWESDNFFYDNISVPMQLEMAENCKDDGHNYDVILAAIKNKLMIYDIKTGKLVEGRNLMEDIKEIIIPKTVRDRLYIITESGKVLLHLFNSPYPDNVLGDMKQIISLGSSFSHNEKAYISCQTDDGIVINENIEDDKLNEIVPDQNLDIKDIQYKSVVDQNGEEKYYRIIGAKHKNDNTTYSWDKTDYLIYEALSDQIKFHFNQNNGYHFDRLEDIYLFNQSGKTYGIIITYAKKEESKPIYTIYAVDIDENQIIDQIQLDECSYGFSNALLNQNNIVAMYDKSNHNLILCSIKDYAIQLEELYIEAKDYDIDKINSVTANGQYLLFELTNYTNKDARYGIGLWDSVQKKWVENENLNQCIQKCKYTSYDYGTKLCLGQKSDIIAIVNDKYDIDIIDLKEDQIIKTIQCGYRNINNLAFFRDDTYLIVTTGDNRLTIYDLSSGLITMTQKYDDRYFTYGLQTDSNGEYFMIQFDGVTYLSTEEGVRSPCYIYYVDDAGQFYPFVEKSFMKASTGGNEVIFEFNNGENNVIRYGHFYTYDELINEAKMYLKEKSDTDIIE